MRNNFVRFSSTLYITVVDIMCISLSFFRNFIIQSISVCKKERGNGREKKERRRRKEKERKRKSVKEIAAKKYNAYIFLNIF